MRKQALIGILITVTSLFAQGQTNYDCKIEFVLKAHENLNYLTETIIKDFLFTFQINCKQNVEYNEFSNETLFEILNSNPQLVISEMIKYQNEIKISIIINELESPVSDRFDLNGIKEKIKKLKIENSIETKIIEALDTAIKKEK